jgi:hypothetical protein
MPTDDIAEQMRYRAIKGYGLDVRLSIHKAILVVSIALTLDGLFR